MPSHRSRLSVDAFDLSRFELADMIACSAALRRIAEDAASMEEAARRVVAYLRNTFVDPATGRHDTALVRLYKLHPFQGLEPDLQDAARASETGDLTGVSCLTLLATAGDEPAWEDRRRSVGHRAIPLRSPSAIEQLPMVEALVEQLGLDLSEVVSPDPALFLELGSRSFNVFYVPEAAGSPTIPAQEEFVRPYGVRSVLGFGGVLGPSGSVFAVILFSKVFIPPETAEMFRSIALTVKIALLPFVNGPVFDSEDAGPTTPDPGLLASQATALEELLDVREQTVVRQTSRLKAALQEAEMNAMAAAEARREREESEARKAAIVDASLEAIVTADDRGVIVEFNPAASLMFGYDGREVVGRRLVDVIVPPSLREAHREGFEAYLRTGVAKVIGRHVELTGLRRDGTEFPVELTITEVAGGSGRFFTGFMRDITHRVESERALVASEHRFRRIARTLQASLLPPDLPDIDGLELAARFHPAGDGTEVGGDFYDVFEIETDDWAIVIGDVCGKGADAAALTALVRYSVRALALRLRRPREILTALNQVVHQYDPDRFVTTIYARIRRQRGRWKMVVASAGHPLCLLTSSDGSVTEVGTHSPVLGILDEIEYTESEHDMRPGDTLAFYTDGVTEAFDGREVFGEDRLRELLASAAGASCDLVADTVESACVNYQQGSTRDDIAVLVIRPSE